MSRSFFPLATSSFLAQQMAIIHLILVSVLREGIYKNNQTADFFGMNIFLNIFLPILSMAVSNIHGTSLFVCIIRQKLPFSISMGAQACTWRYTRIHAGMVADCFGSIGSILLTSFFQEA